MNKKHKQAAAFNMLHAAAFTAFVILCNIVGGAA